MAADRPGGVFAKMPGNGSGKGNAGDDEATKLRSKCKVARRKIENGVLVRSTEVVKKEHHLAKERVSKSVLK